ncbi:MAG: hypothetical protein J0I48_19145 [Devosia sp.]|uniref:hypothetical protein n=1 Tax=Devosia sp. 66-22 TaxID=1895753 RepID=UPI00092C9813|nr:hypothetical protein [Devosia sp. 66-22]MBN9348283.1 hypothetical protein [Devosia sp.]OJX48976.1 MAG: hypothetical protein BGO81_10300 [Devosia sp. 66-22]
MRHVPNRYERGSTVHGMRRLRKRVKIKARAIARMVDRARIEGLRESQMPMWVQILVQHKRTLHPQATDYLFFMEHLWVFQPGFGDLITVYPIEENEPEFEKPDWNDIRAQRRFH